MSRKLTTNGLEQAKEFFLWCKAQRIVKASFKDLAVEFSPLAFIQDPTPDHAAAVKELLDAARDRQAREESAAVSHPITNEGKDDPYLYGSSDK